MFSDYALCLQCCFYQKECICKCYSIPFFIIGTNFLERMQKNYELDYFIVIFLNIKSQVFNELLNFVVLQNLVQCYQFAFRVLLAGAIRCLCIIFPFVAFQAYGYYNMCLGHSPGEARPWCKARLPLLYDYIQSHYWYVDLFPLVNIP